MATVSSLAAFMTDADPHASRVVVVGGGLAGLAAAVSLTADGLPVTLLEARNRLGGRASSFDDPLTGDRLDNCQHVSMGCCTNLQHFCSLVGTQDAFRTEDVLTFIGPDGRQNYFRSSRLPAPLHLWPAFRRLSYLSRADRRELTRGLVALARAKPSALQGQSFQSWLDSHGQSPQVIDRFWRLVLVSALSESLDRIDAAMARKVFVDSFLAHRDGWRIQIPTAPLDEIFGEGVRDWLCTRGAVVVQQSPADALRLTDELAGSVELKDGRAMAGTEFILAVPHFRVHELLPESIRNGPPLSRINEFESAPISSVHLWFDRSITDLPHAVLIDRLSQWMFNRNVLWPQYKHTEYGYQIVISASRDVEEMGREATISAVHDEVCAIWPAAREARLLKSRLVTERRAVFSPTPGCDTLRPPQQSPIANLQIAGDWTQTGWPSTMEGAVRSGFLAAENILRRHGRSHRILQPDLHVSWLSRLLFGLSRDDSTDRARRSSTDCCSSWASCSR
jgi:squalene-associated FAD-dependent desaturase